MLRAFTRSLLALLALIGVPILAAVTALNVAGTSALPVIVTIWAVDGVLALIAMMVVGLLVGRPTATSEGAAPQPSDEVAPALEVGAPARYA